MSAKPHSGIIVSGRPAGRFGIRARLAVLISGAVLLLVLIGGGTLLVVRHLHMDKSPVADPSQKTKQQLTTQQAASEQAHNGAIDQAFATYDAAIKNAKTPAEKAVLYQQKINIAIVQKQYDMAISTGQELIKVSQTSTAYGLLATAYDGKGDKVSALKYYKLAVDAYTNNETHNSNAGIRQYQAKITELSGEVR